MYTPRHCRFTPCHAFRRLYAGCYAERYGGADTFTIFDAMPPPSLARPMPPATAAVMLYARDVDILRRMQRLCCYGIRLRDMMLSYYEHKRFAARA